MQPYPFHFPLSAIAGKPIGSPKMTTFSPLIWAGILLYQQIVVF